MAEFPDAPDIQQIVEGAEADHHGRLIAVAIVMVTLLAATTAWLQAGASRDDDEAAVRAERLASQTLGTTARSKSLAELRIQRERLADERARRAVALRRQRAYGVGNEAEAKALERGWLRAAAATRRNTERIAAAEGIPPLEGELTEDSDPAFPSAYLAAAAREGNRLSSLRDAANREGDRAEEQVGAFGVALAVFAISIFLFGYSLTPYGRRNRGLFAATGTVMALAATLWTLFNLLDGPDRPPEDAAARFADAQLAIAAGKSEQALAALDETLELRPGYPDAYTLRGQIRAGIAGAGFGELPEVVTEEDARAARDDLQRAAELDPESVDAVLALATAELLIGLHGDQDALERAAVAAQQAIQRDPVQPNARYVLALALLGAGAGSEQVDRALVEADSRTALTDDGSRPRDEDGRRRLAAGALTAVDALADSGLVDSGRAEAVKGRVLDDVWPELGPPLPEPDVQAAKPGSGEPAEAFEQLELDVVPAAIEVSWPAPSPERAAGPAAAFRPARDELALVLYAELEDGSWAAISELSGPVRGGELRFDPSSDVAFVRRERLDVTVPPRCLPAGSYRVEAYVNGRLAATAETTTEIETDGAVLLEGLGVNVCSPPGWEKVRIDGGVVEGLVAPDGSAGLIGTRVPAGAAPGRGPAQTRAALAAGLEQLGPELPGPVLERKGLRGPFLDATIAPSEVLRTRKGGSIAAAARLSQGAILVAAVYGPKSFFATDPETGSSESGALFQSVRDRF